MPRGLLKVFILVVLMLASAHGVAGAEGSARPQDAPGLQVNGEAVRTDVPPQIVGGRLIVPLRVVAERLGATITWQPQGERVTLRGDDVTVELAVGSRKALVNGLEVALEVTPAIVNDRTLVPLRFVSEAFGAKVTWDAPSRTAIVDRPHRLREVSLESGAGGGLRIVATGPVRPVVLPSDDETRLVVDLPHVTVPPEGIVMVGTGLVRLVRVTDLAGPPPSARVVIDLARGAEVVLREASPPGQVLVEVREASGPGKSRPLPVAVQQQVPPGPLAGRVIVIDPGHGGVDPGAPGPGGLDEKDIVLSIAGKVRTLLDEAGARVVLTRGGDETIGLYERADVAGQAGAELYVSIHANASPFRSVAGVETYYYPGSREGRRLAATLQRALVSRLGRPDREIHAEDFVVIREPAVPAALVECGYLTNRQESLLLASEEFQLRIARAIVEGITRYFAPADTG